MEINPQQQAMISALRSVQRPESVEKYREYNERQAARGLPVKSYQEWLKISGESHAS